MCCLLWLVISCLRSFTSTCIYRFFGTWIHSLVSGVLPPCCWLINVFPRSQAELEISAPSLCHPFCCSFWRNRLAIPSLGGVCFSHQPSVSVWLRGSLTIQSLFRLTSLLCEQFKLGMARLQPCRIKREESADSSIPSSCIFVCLICFLHPSNSKGFCRDKTQLGNVPRRPQQTYT